MSLGEIPISGQSIAVYKMEGNANDSTANALNGTSFNMTFGLSHGKFSQGASFNGTSSYIEMADNNLFSFTDGSNDLPFTISLWANFTTVTGNRWLIRKRDNSTNDEWQVATQNGVLSMACITNSPGNFINTASGTVISTGVLYNIIATYNGSKSNTGFKLYLNGFPLSVTPGSGGTYTGMNNKTAVVRIGQFLNNSWFQGKMDDIRIENVEWSASKVRKYYTQAKGSFAI